MSLRILRVLLLTLVTIIAFQSIVLADLTMPQVLSSHMVLQRNIPVPVWGTAAPNEKITVEFAGQKKEAAADAQGKWMIKLDPMSASAEPRIMIVYGASGKKQFSDVLVGDAWIGSGQSNMLIRGTSSYVANDTLLDKNIKSGPYPLLRIIIPGKPWMESTPDNLKDFSAMLFSFGLPLQKEINMPVGLMLGAVGGTPSGFWLSQEAFDSDQACRDVIEKFAKNYNYDDAVKKYEAAMEKWKKNFEELKKKGETNQLSREPQKAMKAGECRGKVGNLYEKIIHPYMPYAIKGVLWDQGEHGTGIEGLDQYTLMGALIRGWRKEWGQDFPFIYVQKPSGMGCAWDPSDPVTCKGDNFEKLPSAVPADGQYRETHIRIMNYPNTYMVTSSDMGSGTHPVNKSGYGARAYRVALGAVYGKPLEIYGPVYKSHKVDDSRIIVNFDHVGKGLAFKNGDSLQGFAVAADDFKFEWADAAIEGDTVVLTCAKVAKPVHVRYAWSQNIKWANLFNKDGLPALAFRTDMPSK